MNIKFSEDEINKIDFSEWDLVTNNGRFGEIMNEEITSAMKEQFRGEEALRVEPYPEGIEISLPFGRLDLDDWPMVRISIADFIDNFINWFPDENDDENIRQHMKQILLDAAAKL